MRTFDVSKNYNRNRTKRINWYVPENISMRICLLELDVTFIITFLIKTINIKRGKP